MLDALPKKIMLVISRPVAWLPIRQAREAQRRRDWATAARHWRNVVNAEPRNAGGWIQLGNMLNELEQRDEAIAAFRQAGKLDPKLAHAPAGIAGVHERSGHWQAAEAAWNDAITILSALDVSKRGIRNELVHGLLHAALSAEKNGSPNRAIDHVRRALDLMPTLIQEEHYLSIFIDLSSHCDLNSMPNILGVLIDMLPSHVLEEIGGVPERLLDGLLKISPYLRLGHTSRQFLRLAIVMYERARLWREVILLAEWQAEIEPEDSRAIERAFRAAVEGRLIADARRLTIRHARQSGELMLVHELAKFYQVVGCQDKARLLTRFLCRRWPHSRWHARQYIRLTATSRGLNLSDKLVQIEFKAGRADFELEQAYYGAAFDTGNYNEARLRLQAHLERHDDRDAEVLLGYALANSIGIEDAHRHFSRAAVRQMQSVGTTVGLAHMAMRRRDFPVALKCWRRVAIIHPELTFAHVEIARCAYEMRDIDEAERVCEAYLRSSPRDVAVGEFYAWLLTVNGRYADARNAVDTVQQQSGPSWETTRLSILCAAELGTLDSDWDDITAMMPSSDDDEAGSRFYHAMRSLIAVGRSDLMAKLLHKGPFANADLPWLWPYIRSLDEGRPEHAGRGAVARWQSAASITTSDISDLLNSMSDSDVNVVLAAADGFPVVHIVNKFEQPRGGSELHALDLAIQLSTYAEVNLWAPEMPHPCFTALHGVRAIDPSGGGVPRGGVLVFVGIYYNIANWIGLTTPERIIFLYNTFEAPSLFRRIDEAFRRTGVRPELLYCSTMMQDETGLPGRFEPSPIDLNVFSPASTNEHRRERPFRLGRHSRDVVEKHGAQDWQIYQAVADLGGEAMILGGTCMRQAYPTVPGLHLLPAKSDGIPEFLRGLDAYIYRTSTWVEPWGRVVIEAMACGLPVVAHAVGGYAQAIEHEVNGLLFDTTEEAVRLVRRLVKEPRLRERLGRQACLSVHELLSAAEMKRLLAFYLFRGADLSRS